MVSGTHIGWELVPDVRVVEASVRVPVQSHHQQTLKQRLRPVHLFAALDQSVNGGSQLLNPEAGHAADVPLSRFYHLQTTKERKYCYSTPQTIGTGAGLNGKTR